MRRFCSSFFAFGSGAVLLLASCALGPEAYLYDQDGDGVVTGLDCDDTDPNNVEKAELEVCDGLDNDCDGEVDEGVKTTSYEDGDADGYGLTALYVIDCAVPSGYAASGGDCDDENGEVHPGAPELCDGLDNDCDRAVDEDLELVQFYPDLDGDGFGVKGPTACGTHCVPEGALSVPGCAYALEDCDDTAAGVYPGAVEVCNGVDNDCDGLIDNAYSYADADGDGFGDPDTATTTCPIPAGNVRDGTDCDDSSSRSNPGANEICDGQDNNCDGQVDEDLRVYDVYTDYDGDGYGNGLSGSEQHCLSVGLTRVPGDCNDEDASVHPGATEFCDGEDNDCTGVADDGPTWQAVHMDADGDGYADPDVVIYCLSLEDDPEPGDCDDGDADINPAATEICDGADNDCDGQVDEDFPVLTYYLDADRDGYGQTDTSVEGCSAATGYASAGGDCDDSDAGKNPGAQEVCDGQDNDCDGQADQGLEANTYYVDDDQDGYGDPEYFGACNPPYRTSADPTDCDDADADIYPGAYDVVGDSLDLNCTTDDLIYSVLYDESLDVACTTDDYFSFGTGLDLPFGVAVDSYGRLIVADAGNGVVLQVNDDGVTTLVGGVQEGTEGSESLALDSPLDIAVDRSSNVFICDSVNDRVLKRTSAGIVTVYAGGGLSGCEDEGDATCAQLSQPGSIAVDSSGRLYIADTGNDRICKVDTSGHISTILGEGSAISDTALSQPAGIAVDTSGNVYVADSSNNRVLKLGTSGTVTQIAGTGTDGYSGDGGAATSAKLSKPGKIVVGPDGSVFVADTRNKVVRRVADGLIRSVAGSKTATSVGDCGYATQAKVGSPYGLALDGSGALFIAAPYEKRVRVVVP